MVRGLQNYDIAGTALNAFRTLDNSFRADRQEQADADERLYQRERQAKIDARTDEQFQWQKDDRETRQADEELGLVYADWKAGKTISPSERVRKRMSQLGVELPMGPDNPQQAAQKGAVASQLLGVIEKRLPELEQLPSGTRIPAGEIGQALNTIDPARYSQTYTDDRGEYRVQPSELYLVKPEGKTSFALGLEVLRKDQSGQWAGTGEIVPATKGKSNGADDQVSVISIDDLQGKLKSAAEFNRFYLDSMGSVENYLALKGNKQAAESISEKKSLSKVTGLIGSDSYKTATKGQFAPLVEMVGTMAQQGLVDEKDLAKAVQLATTKEIETNIKNRQDETEASTAVLGYAGMGKDAPRTAAMANQLAGLMKEQKISGKRASKMLELMFNAEQKAADRQATIRAAAARAGGGDNQTKQLLSQIKQTTDDLYGTWDAQYALGNHAPAARQFAQAKAAENAGLGRIIQPKNPERPAVYLTNEMAAALRQRYPNAKTWEELLSFGAGDPQVRGMLESNKLTMWHEGHFANLPQKAETVAAGRERGKAAASPYINGLKPQ